MMVSATLQQFDQPEEIPIEELRRRRLQYFGQAATDKASSSEAVSQKKSEAHYSEEVFNKSIKVTDLILSGTSLLWLSSLKWHRERPIL